MLLQELASAVNPVLCTITRIEARLEGFTEKFLLQLRGARKGLSSLRQRMRDQAEAHLFKHFSPRNRESRMFLSTTDNLLRALNIASQLQREGYEDVCYHYYRPGCS
jgi:hypothetical protein